MATNNLPDHWSRTESTCYQLSKCFGRHVVGLAIDYAYDGESKTNIYTTVLLHAADRLMLMTAGHVVAEIDKLIDHPSVQIKSAAFLDPTARHGQNRIRCRLEDLNRVGSDVDGFDFGLISLTYGYAHTLMGPGTLEPISKNTWFKHTESTPEGFYVIGFPKSEITKKVVSTRGKEYHISFALACLPFNRITREDAMDITNNQEFCESPSALYGQLLPDPIGKFDPIESIVGMSGGPILSVEREDDGGFRYRFFGLQSAWMRNNRIIRGTAAATIDEIVDLMETRNTSQQ